MQNTAGFAFWPTLLLFIYFIYLFADNNNHAVAHNNSE